MTRRPARLKTFLADGFGLGFAWIDLVNSEQRDGFGQVTEHLADPAWVDCLLSVYGFDGACKMRPRASDLKALRAGFRAAAEMIAGGQGLARHQIEDMNRSLAAPVRRQLQPAADGYRLSLTPTTRGWPALRAEFVASFADFLARHQARRLKICPNPGCRWLFYDRTNGNMRRWCNDKTCGNRDKVRRLRRRRASTKGGERALGAIRGRGEA
jgi:predicted RNA-binding Zn ribbon-like protein